MIALIPAAGTASRFGGIPKMLLPTPRGTLMSMLLDKLSGDEVHVASASPVFGVLNALYGDRCQMHEIAPTSTMSQTVLAMQQYAGDRNVVFAMPDTCFEDYWAFALSLWALEDDAMVAVGMFQARPDQHTEGGMCVVEGDRVTRIVDKAQERVSDWIWGVMAWKPDFWQYIHEDDPHVGYAAQRLLMAGIEVRAVKLAGGFWDAGTPDRYFKLLDHMRGR